MSAFDRESWGRLKIVRALLDKPEGAEAWHDISETARHLAPILFWRPRGLEEFTDHDLDHSYRIARAIGAILPDMSSVNRKELDMRMEEMGEIVEWLQIKQDLKRLQEVVIEQSGSKIALRTESLGDCHKVFKAIGMALPPTIRKIEM